MYAVSFNGLAERTVRTFKDFIASKRLKFILFQYFKENYESIFIDAEYLSHTKKIAMWKQETEILILEI